MSNKLFTVSDVFYTTTRQILVEKFAPIFANIYCFGITWAYGVPAEYPVPADTLWFNVTGRHVGDGHEALVGFIHGADTSATDVRPDGKRMHITLSTADGVPPARSGDIDPSRITPCKPFTFSLHLRLRPRRVMQPERLEAW